MKLRMMLVMGIAVLSLGLVPAVGVADGPDYQPDGPTYHPEHPDTPKGPKRLRTAKPTATTAGARARNTSKARKGPPSAAASKRMAQADKNDALTAKKACKTLSKKHVKGVKGTPFSSCVKGVNQMRREEDATVTTSSVA